MFDHFQLYHDNSWMEDDEINNIRFKCSNNLTRSCWTILVVVRGIFDS